MKALNENAFAKLMLGEFSVKERDDLPWRLAKEYYARCDAYDETVCTGRGHEGPVPANGYEFRLVNMNANKVLRELQQRIEVAGFAKADLRDAMREYMKDQK